MSEERSKRIRAVAGGLIGDAIGICGFGLVCYGAWLVYEPAGFIVGGLGLIVSAILIARQK